METDLTKVTIRPATEAGDMGWILMSNGQVFVNEFGWDLTKVEYSLVSILADLIPHRFDPGFGGWIAEVNGSRVGSVMCLKVSETVGKLRLLLVQREGRGRGIGRLLVQTVIAHARGAGFRKLVLTTTSEQAAGQRLYDKLGFVKTGTHYGIKDFGPVLDQYTYELPL